MTFLAQLRSWWNALVHRTRVDNDIEAELQFHINAHTEAFEWHSVRSDHTSYGLSSGLRSRPWLAASSLAF
jgi:hypothetical protein